MRRFVRRTVRYRAQRGARRVEASFEGPRLALRAPFLPRRRKVSCCCACVTLDCARLLCQGVVVLLGGRELAVSVLLQPLPRARHVAPLSRVARTVGVRAGAAVAPSAAPASQPAAVLLRRRLSCGQRRLQLHRLSRRWWHLLPKPVCGGRNLPSGPQLAPEERVVREVT